MRCRYKLIGPQEGKSGRFGSFVFRDGYSAWMDRPPGDWDLHDLQMLRYYSSEREYEVGGNGSAEGSSKAAFQQNGKRSTPRPEDPVEDDAPDEGWAPGRQAKASGGYQRTQDPVSLQDALDALDPSEDDHWTQSGKPSLPYLRTATGQQIQRIEVDRAASWISRGHLAANAAENK